LFSEGAFMGTFRSYVTWFVGVMLTGAFAGATRTHDEDDIDEAVPLPAPRTPSTPTQPVELGSGRYMTPSESGWHWVG
jgi:hypothetical protein